MVVGEVGAYGVQRLTVDTCLEAYDIEIQFQEHILTVRGDHFGLTATQGTRRNFFTQQRTICQLHKTLRAGQLAHLVHLFTHLHHLAGAIDISHDHNLTDSLGCDADNNVTTLVVTGNLTALNLNTHLVCGNARNRNAVFVVILSIDSRQLGIRNRGRGFTYGIVVLEGNLNNRTLVIEESQITLDGLRTGTAGYYVVNTVGTELDTLHIAVRRLCRVHSCQNNLSTIV